MKKRHTLIGILFASILGTTAHFMYEFSNCNTLVGIFTPINESIWEHLKLLFFPVIVFSLFEYFARGKDKRFIPARSFALFVGMFFIVGSYYTISGVIGRNIDWINIALFFISVIIVFILTEISLKNQKGVSVACVVACLIAVVVTALLFVVWTFYPPNLNIFIDHRTSLRGIYGI